MNVLSKIVEINMRRGFTMIELIFVIVIIGILAGVAVPRFVATRDSALISKAKNEVASIRAAILLEKQKRYMSGNFKPIATLDVNGSGGLGQNIFTGIDGNSEHPVFFYEKKACADAKSTACWVSSGTAKYKYIAPNKDKTTFRVELNRFICVTLQGGKDPLCDRLTS